MASVVGGSGRETVAEFGGHLLRAVDRSAGESGVRHLRRAAFCRLPCGTVGSTESSAGTVYRLLEYFEGLNSEQAIAWQMSDSASARAFLEYDLEKMSRNHSAAASRRTSLLDCSSTRRSSSGTRTH